jgi:hypothetical protein
MSKRIFVPSVLLLAMVSVGCAARVGVGYRSYDPYYHDYHTWNDAEGPHFNAWIVETHHPQVDYVHASKRDRENYWRWRHDHP